MVEKPLTHSKRKANVDMDKLKPELRQLEEQFVIYLCLFCTWTILTIFDCLGSLSTISADHNAFRIIRITNLSSP
jgi:hypothetical protein